MTSLINPNNIDANYPVAGVPNNTQGFRDNFTNIQTNFQYAEDEINELQTKSLLKAAITGSTLDNNMNDNLLYAAKIQDFSATLVQVTATAGSVTIDYAAGHYQTVSTTGSISLSFINFPVSGSVGMIRLSVNITSTAHTLTLPAAVSVNNQGIQGLNTANNTITFAATGLYDFEFVTRDGGTTIIVSEVNKRIQPLNNSSEDLADAAAANLALTTSYFTTAAAETATLAAGVEGQIKTFAMVATAGDMVITVANAGWQASGTGTITFDTRGDACTLQYINSKWYCIGNNGCTFA
jgi:hypothetical protein